MVSGFNHIDLGEIAISADDIEFVELSEYCSKKLDESIINDKPLIAELTTKINGTEIDMFLCLNKSIINSDDFTTFAYVSLCLINVPTFVTLFRNPGTNNWLIQVHKGWE